jgi:predicted nucleic acid-binding protein
MPGSFADSNVVLYLASPDRKKSEIAWRLFASELFISVQVLNEVANVFRGRWRRSWDETEAFLSTIGGLVSVLPLDHESHHTGLRIARRYTLNIYDGMIVSAALLAGCDTLYSEDMHNGLVVDEQLRIVNPFA